MKIQTIITGSWYPRTRFHIQEWHDFLADGKSHIEISKTAVKKAQRKLMPADVQYIGLSDGGRFDRVIATLDDFATSFFEDGLMLIAKQVTDLDKDRKALHKFYSDRLSPSLRLIFSVGVPAITFRTSKERARTTIFLSKAGSRKDVEKLITKYDDEISHISKHKGHVVYFAKDSVVVIASNLNGKITDKIITSIIFSREFEGRLNNFLNLHRKVWSNIQDIRAKKKISLAELPKVRDLLLDSQRDLSIVKARLEQMRDYLIERKLEIDEIGLEIYMRKLELYRFGKMKVNSLYMNRLWGMLEDYISSTLKIIELMYQENIQRQLGIQQFIFLIGAIGGILALGKLSGEQLTIYTDSGEPAYIWALLFFSGLALVLSVIVFVLIKKLLPMFTGIRTGHLFGNKKLLEEEKTE